MADIESSTDTTELNVNLVENKEYNTYHVVECCDKENSRITIVKEAEKIVSSMYHQIARGESPSFTLKYEKKVILGENSEGNSNGVPKSQKVEAFRKMSFQKADQRMRMALMMEVMQNGYSFNLSDGGRQKKRRWLYYTLQETPFSPYIRKQEVVDRSIDNVSVLMGCNESDLGFVPCAKGLAVGKLILQFDNGREIDFGANPNGTLITHDIVNAKIIRHKVKRVIVIEKDTIFSKLAGENCVERLKCFLVTGKGYPDVITRKFVKMLSEIAKLPVFVLVDGNPDGIEIFCTYKYGAMKRSKNLSCLEAKWIGVFPSDLHKFGDQKTSKLTERDIQKSLSIMSRPYVSNEIKKELQIIDSVGKIQIDTLSQYSQNFLTLDYLPRKIRGGSCIG